MSNAIQIRYLIAGSRSAFSPKPSSSRLLACIKPSSTGSTFSSAILPSRMAKDNSPSSDTVARAALQIASCPRDICGGRTSSNIAARFAPQPSVRRGAPPAAIAINRIDSIIPHSIIKHCLARLKFSLSVRHFCQYGTAPATKTARREPTNCIHPLHSALVMHSGHQSIQNRQYSCGGFAAFAASASAFINWLVSMSVPQIALR